MGDSLALATCLSRGCLAHGCYLDLSCVPLPWLLPYGSFHKLGSMHVGMPWPCMVISGEQRGEQLFLNF